jgi:hypothetical protein
MPPSSFDSSTNYSKKLDINLGLPVSAMLVVGTLHHLLVSKSELELDWLWNLGCTTNCIIFAHSAGLGVDVLTSCSIEEYSHIGLGVGNMGIFVGTQIAFFYFAKTPFVWSWSFTPT